MPEGEEELSSRPRLTPRSGTEAVGSRNGTVADSLAMTSPDDPDPADPDPVTGAAPDPDAPDPADPDAADCADAADCTPSGNDGGGAEVFCSLQ